MIWFGETKKSGARCSTPIASLILTAELASAVGNGLAFAESVVGAMLCPNAATIHRVLNGQGCRASYYAVRRFVRRRRAALGVPSARSHAGQTTPPRPPSARLLSYEFLRRPENRDSDAQAHVEALLGCDGLGDALDLAGQFVDMVRKRLSQPLADWLAKAEHSTCAEVRSFAKGIRQDEAAVTAALTESWSNGPVEGHVNRLKFIKRAGFGRAGFQLLRARVRWAA